MKKLIFLIMTLASCASMFAGLRVVDFVFAEHEHSCEVQAPLSDGLPDAERIAADLVGVRFIETTKDGFFKDKEWKFAADDKLTVKIAKVERVNDDVKFCVTIDLLTPTRGRYTIDGEVRYYHSDNGWVFDMFLGNSIMPQITNAYNNCITIKHKGWKGQRSLEFINHSNVKLGVYVSLKIWLKDEIHKGRVVVEPNEKKEIGGLFIGDIEEYTLHYIERY